jgi:hypothetical protein
VELHEALSRIDAIHRQLAGTETFRGYRSATVASSGVTALLAAGAQAIWIPEPTANLHGYLSLWIGAAALSVALVGVEIAVRSWQSQSAIARRLTLLAIEQFAPCLVVGALLTAVVVRAAPDSAWMLPGLWALVFSLGVFASCRLLPRASVYVATYYAVAGLVCLAVGQGAAALSPWTMAAAFGGGQLLTAVVLFCTLERHHGAH